MNESIEKGGGFITETEYLEYLIDAYGNLIYAICYKACGNPFDAEDLTQDTFLSAFRSLNRFDRQFEKAWLCKIASRKCIDFLKSTSRRMLPTEDCYFEETGCEESIEHDYLEHETMEQLLLACNSLKPPYAQIARLHFYEEQTAAEIAAATQTNLKTIQTQIYRAKAMLRQKLRPGYTSQPERGDG